jgi:hypothetical protein
MTTKKKPAPFKLPTNDEEFEEYLGANKPSSTHIGKPAPYQPNIRNSWPSTELLPIIGARYMTDILAWENWFYEANSKYRPMLQEYRQCMVQTVPREVFMLMVERQGWENRSREAMVEARCYLTWSGQVCIMIPAAKALVYEYDVDDEGRHSEYLMTRPPIMVIQGCQHDYEHTLLGNCYHGHTCKKCGHYYTVDSGD